MGWNSANPIFNAVADDLIATNASDETKRLVLGDLIAELQNGDWDTEDESLDRYSDDPAIVAAFREHGVQYDDEFDTEEA
jgi:hypothetical protein